MKTKFLFILLLIASSGYSQALKNLRNAVSGNSANSSYIRMSPDANIVLDLSSSEEETSFYVDGQFVGTAERLKVLVDKNEHKVEAEPKGYRRKKDLLQPPYMNKYASIRFTFLLEDRLSADNEAAQDEPVAQNSLSKPEVKKAAKVPADVDMNIPQNSNQYPYRFALIIGNEDYSTFQTDLSSEVDVAFAKNDASVFREYAIKTLGVPEANAQLLLNATAGQMRQALAKINKLAEKSAGQAELIFYYAGHGLPDEVTKDPYLIPVDVAGTNVQFGLKLTEIYKSLTQFNTERVTVFLDACFSGGARGQGLVAARGVKIKPKEETLNGKLVVFSASSGDQSSLPYKEKGHGIFTYFLLKKLQDTKGEVSYKELSDYLRSQVSLQSVVINSKEQDPQTNISPSAVAEWEKWKLGKK
ncbi:MAG: caspase family protein [Cyclobacteriaceae bacterium]